MMSLRYALGLTLLLSLGACQSTVPVEIREAPPGTRPLARPVKMCGRSKGCPCAGRDHRLHQEPRERHLIEILGKALGSDGEPVAADDSLGRFMVRVEGFLDPSIYRPGRDVTVHGSLEKPMERPVGERPYTFPVVQSQTLYLWPDEPDYYSRDTGPDIHFGVGVGFGFGD